MVDIFNFINLIEGLQKVCAEKSYSLEIGFPPVKDAFFLEVGVKKEFYTILEGVYVQGDKFLSYQESGENIIRDAIYETVMLEEITEFPGERREE